MLRPLRFAVTSIATGLALAALSGCWVVLDESCGPNACGQCAEGFVNVDRCEEGRWACSCVARADAGGTSTCTMAPACRPGDRKLAAGEKCVPDAPCYEQRACGIAILCMSDRSECDGVPECNEGDQVVKTCPPSATCYSRSACGTTITCLELPAPIWPSDANALLAVDEGGGFAPTPPPGSQCKIGSATYNYDPGGRTFSFSVCNTSVSPYVNRTGSRVVSVAEGAAIDAAMSKVKRSSATSCGSDKSLQWMAVTSASRGTTKFYDSFYACEKKGVYVDGLGGVLATFADLAK